MKEVSVTDWTIMFYGLPGIGLIVPGDDMGAVIVRAAAEDGFTLADQDVVIVAQKAVSKAEGRIVDLATITPSPRARKLAERTGRDPRLCQVYLEESRAIIDIKGRHVVTVDNRGLLGTGAGVDRSNVSPHTEGRVVLLPTDPDASARRIRDQIRQHARADVAVIVSDSFGSANRDGAIGAAIGIAGIRHLEEPDGERDLFGNPSQPAINRVDEIAAAASIIMGQTSAALPVVIGRGIPYTRDDDAAISRLLAEPQLPEIDYDLRPTATR
jgi:coenzyme F420-0:L-glutamate ligase / coenzyme F420-1:gamma-L-glutamate ligase